MHRVYLLALGLTVGWMDGPALQPPAGPNVLLITIDTLRADRIGAYGYKGARTPTLDKLAAEGVRFADATAHAPLTYPSHVSILTGRYAGAFGVRLNGMDPLTAEATTIAEQLGTAGYSTGAVVASVVLDKATGLAQGFDEYDDRVGVQVRETAALADLQRPASAVTAAARGWIAGQQGRWFLWAHYYDPHLPYDAPAQFRSLSPGRPYDAEVAFADAQIGQLLSGVDRGRTAVIVTADHGEALGEHGEADHGFFLYDATLRVPLIVAAPGLAPRVVDEQVRLIDVAPTIAQLAGVSPAGGSDGQSLVPLLRGESRRDVPVSLAESWYPRLHFGWSELRSARVGEWKYIAAPKPELYDLRTDRGEQRNLVQERSVVAGRLAADLAKISSQFARAEAPRPAQPDAATIQRLQALGYVGSFAPVTASSGADDPKDRVKEYTQYRELFNRALTLLERRQAAAAAQVLQRLVKSNVRAFEAHLYLGNAYAAQGRHDAALGEYDVASQLNPSVATPHYEAAKAFSAKGEPAMAAARCRKGLDLEPQSFYGHFTLGVIHQKAGQWTEAAAAFARAVEMNDRDPRAHANLAGVSMRLGDLDRAALHFRRMVELKHQVAAAQYNLGVIAARRGDRAGAERQYRLAIAADPGFKPALDALARLKGPGR
jgi:arylsulfatase A-like enzyme/Tfp pilus assembly protein PilF